MGAAAQALLLLLLAVALEWSRALAERNLDFALAALVAGGAALCSLGFLYSPRELGLDPSRLAYKLLAGALLGLVLLLPAFARGYVLPGLPAPFAAAAVCVSIGEEVAFRGALFVALRRVGGPAMAVAGTSLAFTLGHVLSHPVAFLFPVLAFGILLSLWRWAFDDLVAPIVAHVFADFAL